MSIFVNLMGLANGKALCIPIQISARFSQLSETDKGEGSIGKELIRELPYIRSVVSRLFPEMFLFLKNVELTLVADLDPTYDYVVEETISAQLPLALALCLLLRRYFNLPCLEKFAATGALDPLGFITYVDDVEKIS